MILCHIRKRNMQSNIYLNKFEFLYFNQLINVFTYQDKTLLYITLILTPYPAGLCRCPGGHSTRQDRVSPASPRTCTSLIGLRAPARPCTVQPHVYQLSHASCASARAYTSLANPTRINLPRPVSISCATRTPCVSSWLCTCARATPHPGRTHPRACL